MSATKILWGQVLAVSMVGLTFLWGATEWTAWRLAFQPELGRPWFEAFGWPVYLPFAFFWWWFSFDAYAHEIFVEGGYIAASGGIAAFVVAVVLSIWRAREAKHAITYGSARWAERRLSATTTTSRGAATGSSSWASPKSPSPLPPPRPRPIRPPSPSFSRSTAVWLHHKGLDWAIPFLTHKETTS